MSKAKINVFGEFDAEAYARLTARAVGLPLREEDVTHVAANLRRAAEFAAVLTDVPNLDSTDSALVFRPGEKS